MTKAIKISLIYIVITISQICSVQLSAANSIDERVFSFHQKMADSGNTEAQFKLAYMYEIGRGVGKDISQAKQWYKKSFDNGLSAARHRLMYLNYLSSGFSSQSKQWINELIQEARDDHHAMFLLANMYENGKGVSENLEKARHYYQQATARGNADAEAHLFKLKQKIQAKKAIQQAEAKEREKAREIEQKKAELEAKRLAAEKKKLRQLREKALAEKRAKEKLQREKAARELAAKEKQRITQAEKEKLKAKQEALAKTQAKQDSVEDELFETDLCSGKAARFRTQCN